ncbi:DUF7114 family protein [Halalkalicoccus jeotgali]|uniref:Polyprenyl synthetase n=1 Tax=Halalkalicoccus jeotgali (strain DSM 18796 / CECT 7217 / JCM 14584 / KCTC 4019 / B3) TaxID=795797 RepID=D8J8T1_HALJB|nr:hypothetical protein [Halalkalicoccus jeotgali]ADJ14266.1 hypothetical protein HacjB3_04375 [Halalkalicoccus jeotgali B3]ELY40528.1 hypothetical protein C497_02737 [Halalkalicoccus jeotgali B3]
MEQAESARRGAREALADIEPPRLADRIDSLLATASMAPGALVLLVAQRADPAVDPEALAERAAGVQLIYEGLRLTRTLAHEEPWADSEDQTAANLDVLAADILVSRGFYLLAMTDAADRAVETIRAFGRDQTHRRESEADRAALDANLEGDVLELAGVAGASAVERSVSPPVQGALDRLASRAEAPLPDAAALFRGTALLSGPDGHAPPSATDP